MMAEVGLTEADYGAPVAAGRPRDVEIWPDVWPSFLAFRALLTQWRVAFGGPSGLDYNAIPFVLRMQGIARREWPAIFEDLRVMESAALEALAGVHA